MEQLKKLRLFSLEKGREGSRSCSQRSFEGKHKINGDYRKADFISV